MKTKRIVLAALSVSLLAAVGLSLPRLARAESPESLGTWEGTGTTSEIDGKQRGPFTIVLTRTSLGAGSVRADGKIRTSDGKEIVFWQETNERGAGRFRLTSSFGSGGGICFANGICQSLEQRADGHSFASTIVKDGPDHLRVLVTELKDGQAVRFHAQTLAKKP